jgi:hypothetical protein
MKSTNIPQEILHRMEELLREVNQHNQTVKVMLRDIRATMSSVWVLMIFFLAKDLPVYVRFIVTSSFLAFFLHQWVQYVQREWFTSRAEEIP